MKFSPILFVVFVASAAWWPMADAVYVQSNSSELSARLLGSVDLPFEPPWFPSSVLRVQFWYRDFLSDKMYPRGWCGATVVSPRTLLTAAHCIRGVNKKLPDATYAIVFDELGKKFDDIYGVPIRHPEHNPIRHANDIAVVHLNKAITRPPVQLASAGTYTDKPLCRVIGFGGDGLTPSKRMQAIDVPLGSDEVCRLKRKIWDDVREMCTDDPEHKKKICKGDGGGPLMCLAFLNKDIERWYQFGIVSFSRNSCNSSISNTKFNDYPTYYTKVGHFYRWIQDNTKK